MPLAQTETLKAYYLLTKPGIIRGNVITAIAGFCLASRGTINFGLLLTALGGLILVIASACVCNNYLDRHIDAKMVRTKRRALASGTVSAHGAILYAGILGILGVVLLLQTNYAATVVALIGFASYVILYSYWKRRSAYGTLVGSISGATPPVIGYTAVSGQLDMAALLLFLILVVWQMPHFYAIALYRLHDYQSAGIPVLPAVKGRRTTQRRILAYVAAFIIIAPLLTVFGYTGLTVAAVAVLLGVYWLWLGLQGFKAADIAGWARRMFVFSLIVISALSLVIAADVVLP